jgi:hypothetical protein
LGSTDSYIKIRIFQHGFRHGSETNKVEWRRLLVTANVVPSSPILDALMKEALSSTETSVLKSIGRNIPEDGILHSHHRKKPQILHRNKVMFIQKLSQRTKATLCSEN